MNRTRTALVAFLGAFVVAAVSIFALGLGPLSSGFLSVVAILAFTDQFLTGFDLVDVDDPCDVQEADLFEDLVEDVE